MIHFRLKKDNDPFPSKKKGGHFQTICYTVHKFRGEMNNLSDFFATFVGICTSITYDGRNTTTNSIIKQKNTFYPAQFTTTEARECGFATTINSRTPRVG